MSAPKTVLPVRKRTYRVALTPLADAMFQLLTFFMLTTSLTPFSLITIRSSQEAPAAEEVGVENHDGEADGQGNVQDTVGNLVIWELEDGMVNANGTRFERDQLGELSEALASNAGEVSVQLVVGLTARIQDVASAMAALSAAEVHKVELKRFEDGL